MNPIRLSLLLALAAAAPSQEQFGKWDGAPPATQAYFVSPGGFDFFPGTLQLPVRTITRAVQLAMALPTARAVSINVFPGTYDTVAGELFPVTVPAHGIAIEAYAAYGAMPLIDTSMSSGVTSFAVQGLGDETLPHSSFRGLRLTLGSSCTGISITTSGIDQTVASMVEVAECTISGLSGAVGVRIRVLDDGVAAHRLVHNYFAGDPPVSAGTAIFENAEGGASSTLMRSNQAWRWEFTYRGSGAAPALYQPRFLGNAFQHSETMISITNGESWFLNTTLAYATPFSAAMVPLIGIEAFNGTVHVHDSILWIPPVPGYTTFDFTGNAALDLQFSDFFNAYGGTNLSLNPVHIGNPGGANPGLVVVDLHLSPLSPMIGAGSVALVDPIDTVSLMMPNGTTLPLRKDVAFDIDEDPGLTARGGVVVDDIGGDQFHFQRVTPAVTANPLQQLDAFGNLRPFLQGPGGLSYQTAVDITGPPSGSFVLMLGFGFFDTVSFPAVENEEVFQNTLVPTIGCYHLGLGPTEAVQFLAGGFNAAGAAQVVVPLGTHGPNIAPEIQAFLQVVTIAPAGNAATTSRQRIELNQ